MTKKACRDCKRILNGNICPVCKTSNITTNFQGVVLVFDPESVVAKKLGITAPGKYALKV